MQLNLLSRGQSSFLLAIIVFGSLSAAQTTAPEAEPSWFQTVPQSFQGPTPTGSAPFLAQTNPVFPAPESCAPHRPLQTPESEPESESESVGGSDGRDIFQLMGNLSPYHPATGGFGVDEYPIPKGTNITQAHLLQRHGARYPSSFEGQETFAEAIANSTQSGNSFKGPLEFLNNWTYKLGKEILVPKGRQEMFESGVANFYSYGHLYDSASKLVVRTTTQDRMLKSAENFLAGFFGLEWRESANILTSVDYTVSMQMDCDNAMMAIVEGMMGPVEAWKGIYLKERTADLQELAGDYNWTESDTYNAQQLCPYETVGLGYSDFCSLFTYEDWEGFEYATDISGSTMTGFASPVGRAMGIAWVAEFIARVEGRLLDVPVEKTGANMTVDTNPVTFPLDQPLFFEFTHDANLVSVLTAFGLTQFAEFLPETGPPPEQAYVSSKISPFAGRLNIEILYAPHQVSPERPLSASGDPYIADTPETRYVHFILNQRTIPLHASFEECEYRDDGWCELTTFLELQNRGIEEAQYQHSCVGDWTTGPYGSVQNGVPPEASSTPV